MPRDSAQRLEGSPVKLEISRSNVDQMAHPIPFTDQLCPNGRPKISPNPTQGDVAAVEPLAQRLQPGHGLGLQPAVNKFLDAVRQAGLQVASAEGRRLLTKQLELHLFQVGRGSGLQRCEPAQYVGGRDSGDR
jgi:hypothetical protein